MHSEQLLPVVAGLHLHCPELVWAHLFSAPTTSHVQAVKDKKYQIECWNNQGVLNQCLYNASDAKYMQDYEKSRMFLISFYVT